MSARLEKEGIPASATARRDYRELLLTADGLAESISGIILADETFGQLLNDGRSFPDAARELGILPGIKVDTGTTPLPGQGGALITEGLDGLGTRLASYAERGAAFAKWRAVFDVNTITTYTARANGHALARYAALCQEHGIVPIVEPEVVCNGGHDLVASADASRLALRSVFDELDQAGVDLTGIVLKPNFVTPGLDATPVTAPAVMAATFCGAARHCPVRRAWDRLPVRRAPDRGRVRVPERAQRHPRSLVAGHVLVRARAGQRRTRHLGRRRRQRASGPERAHRETSAATG